jgi:hypothetical protein
MSALEVRTPVRRLRLMLLGASVVLVVGIGWAVVPVSSGASVRSTGSISSRAVGTLTGVTCISAKTCFAVGYLDNTTLIESWNGSAWSIVPSPDRGFSSALFGVSCSSARSCVAVGDYADSSDQGALIESWNGTAWSVVPSPSPGSAGAELLGVSCASASSCKAVGGYDGSALIESWNGTAWSVGPSPSAGFGRSQLDAVTCLSASSCVAVGNRAGTSLVESWNGSTWSVVPSPTPGTYGGLAGVSCSSASSCVAVGDYSTGTGSGASTLPRTLAESWNGSTWSVVPIPSPSVAYLFATACVSARWCQAVGGYQEPSGLFGALIESWNGSAWSVVPNPGPSVAYLYGVSCVATNSCHAVGESAENAHGTGPRLALMESWNGSTWSV